MVLNGVSNGFNTSYHCKTGLMRYSIAIYHHTVIYTSCTYTTQFSLIFLGHLSFAVYIVKTHNFV
jgi:hypothetical protein